MKVFNAMEAGMVSGGADVPACTAPATWADSITDLGKTIPQEIGNFFVGLNQLGSDLGIWLYNMTHSC